MTTLHWIFTNGHRWHKEFHTTEDAEAYADLCGFFKASAVDRVWIDTDTEQIWLKEKHPQLTM